MSFVKSEWAFGYIVYLSNNNNMLDKIKFFDGG